jgi:predicted aspartyl protease
LNAAGNKAVQAWYTAMLTGGNQSFVSAAQLAEQRLQTAIQELKAPAAPLVAASRSEVPLERRGGSYWANVEINRAASSPFLVDTGAEDFVIPFGLFEGLVEAGALTPGDTLGGPVPIGVAGGATTVGATVNIREVRVGDWVARNVAAVIVPGGDPLLGQSVLSRFGSVTVDYQRQVLVMSR